MKNSTVLKLSAILILFSFFTTGCKKSPSPKIYDENVIVVAVVGAHSGKLSAFGLPTLNAVNMVVEDVNSRGGLLNKKVVVKAIDDGCKIATARNVAGRIVDDGIQFVIGHMCSNAVSSTMPLYEKNGIIAITSTASDVSLTRGPTDFFFRTIAPKDSQAKILATRFIDKGYPKISVIYEDSEYGNQFSNHLKRWLANKGGTNVSISRHHVDERLSSSLFSDVEAAKPDAICFVGSAQTSEKTLKKLRKIGINTDFYTNFSPQSMMTANSSMPGSVYIVAYPKIESTPTIFEKDNSLDSETPGAFFFEGYAAATALMQAIDRAGTTETTAVSNSLKSGLFLTPYGEIGFDEQGEITGAPWRLVKIQ